MGGLGVHLGGQVEGTVVCVGTVVVRMSVVVVKMVVGSSVVVVVSEFGLVSYWPT